ncbi:MAG: hypothetical protein KGL55_17760, partial [Rhodospirillales bacterium]|nr:hypothetical protein [Rhodospirillales bacterium]
MPSDTPPPFAPQTIVEICATMLPFSARRPARAAAPPHFATRRPGPTPLLMPLLLLVPALLVPA